MEDRIFLLSVEEYERYKKSIPHINMWWWLRSPGIDSAHATFIDCDGSIYDRGDFVFSSSSAVRPALRVTNQNFEIGERVDIACFPWIAIDTDLVIAEVPIAFKRFDEKSNNYETSEIRRFLLDWYKERT